MSDETRSLADQYAEEIAIAFLKWVAEVKAHLPSDILSFIGFNPLKILGMIYVAGAKEQDRHITAAVGYKFDRRLWDAEAWLSRYGAARVTAIDTETRLALRQILLTGFQEGKTYVKMSQEIRPFIGLSRPQAQALAQYRKLPGVTDRMVERRAAKMVRTRAKTIALTESHLAMNAGVRASNVDAVRRGILDPAKYERSWLTTPDERRCPRCGAMHGKRADLPNGTFEGDGQGPPLHPRCRCTEIIVSKRGI